MNVRRLAVVGALCATAAVAGWLALPRPDVGLFHAAAMPVEAVPAPVSVPAPAVVEVAPIAAAKSEDMASRDDAPTVQAALPVSLPQSEPAPPPAASALPPPVAALPTPDPAPTPAEPAPSVAASDDCVLSQSCIDRYLWSIYQRTPKQDTITVSERVKVTIKSKGKTRTVTKTVAKLVDEDFTWKDPKAAEKAGMPLMEYVIGGMDPSFKLKLYRACRAMDDAGLVPGITSAFRDDYRQALASGKKAATDRSYHGGSLRGGYGHGLAADLVSAKGETRAERWITSEILWKWIDAHGHEYGVGRPYLDRDPPHVGPIDGKEYVEKRARAKTKVARSGAHKHPASTEDKNHSKPKAAKTASR
jgi:hypothetical protein